MSQTTNKRKAAHGCADEDAAKRHQVTFNKIADEWVCPITMELPLDPVMAEDGHFYERSAIEQYFTTKKNGLTSPHTNEPMGRRLVPATQARNTIERLVKSGTIDGDKADNWKQRFEDEKELEPLMKGAENGDMICMYHVGIIFKYGDLGQKQDDAKAFHWFKKSADLHYPPSMAMAGELLTLGQGVEKNISLGTALTGMAATAGSDHAAFSLGILYSSGQFGFEKNPDQAKYWFKSVNGIGSKKFRTLGEACKTAAREYVEKLEQEE